MIQKYTKRPAVIEAIQFTESSILETFQFVYGILNEPNSEKAKDAENIFRANKCFSFTTSDGLMTAYFGDYIVKDVNGEFYASKPETFHKTFQTHDDGIVVNEPRQTPVEWLIKEIDSQYPHINILWKEWMIEQAKEKEQQYHTITEDTSDGYHTFKELYEFRKMYNAALFNEWAKQKKHLVHKSFRHSDGEPCFGGGWFIVIAMLPTGMISNHYEEKDWDLFRIPAQETALFDYDGHTSADVLKRIKAIL
jgi:hypothetical protein